MCVSERLVGVLHYSLWLYYYRTYVLARSAYGSIVRGYCNSLYQKLLLLEAHYDILLVLTKRVAMQCEAAALHRDCGS
jgi:hypothetical protein